MSNLAVKTRPGRLSYGGTTFRLSTMKTQGGLATRPVIIGAGVAGVASAIALLDVGLDPIILEQRADGKLLGGAGINCQAKAIEALNSLGVSTSTMKAAGRVIKKQSYYTPDGRHVASLDKTGDGTTPGQIGIHRGTLIQLLLDVAKSRDIEVLMKHHVSTIDQMSSPGKITIKSTIRSNAIPTIIEGSMVIGADGLNSLVRRHYISGNRDKDPQHYHGVTHYRGVVENFPSFLDSSTMVLAGGVKGVKAVVYPIGNPCEKGLQTINWVLAVEEDEINQDTSTHCEHIVKLLRANGFNLDFLDIESLITKCEDIQAWPMVDLDPLDTWTDANIALAGDAAHGMLPVGSGGAMAALLDALALKEAFEKNENAPHSEVLRIYEELRYKDASMHQGKCRQQPAENIVQEAMDNVPATSKVPPEYEQRIQEVMKNIHNAGLEKTTAGENDVIALGVSKGIITEEQAAALRGLAKLG